MTRAEEQALYNRLDFQNAWRGGPLLPERESKRSVLEVAAVLDDMSDTPYPSFWRSGRKKNPSDMCRKRAEKDRARDRARSAERQAERNADYALHGPRYCECGCGRETGPGSWRFPEKRFVRGHNANMTAGKHALSGYAAYHRNRKAA